MNVERISNNFTYMFFRISTWKVKINLMKKKTGFYSNRGEQRRDIAECPEVPQVGVSHIRAQYETFAPGQR